MQHTVEGWAAILVRLWTNARTQAAYTRAHNNDVPVPERLTIIVAALSATSTATSPPITAAAMDPREGHAVQSPTAVV